MKSLIAVAVVSLASLPVYAQAAKPCEELKAEIAKKMEANKVMSYTLEIVPTEKAKETEGKVVGSCDGGTKKIVYQRASTPKATSATELTKP